ncbi:MAG: L-2-hydroxyglutarate oxidase [Candidatus Xenobia bacterium]
MEHVDLTVVGAGLVGLATARALLQVRPDLKLVVLEKEPRVAAHQSSHNSGVIHSGIYYKPGSFKARLCLEGAEAMQAFCDQHSIPWRRCGKLIVATRRDELPRLQTLYENGRQNGIAGELLAPEAMREREPAVAGLQGIYVPTTGVVDFARVAEALARQLGNRIRLGAPLFAARRERNGIVLNGDLKTRWLINCGGLHCDRIARLLGDRSNVRIIPFRGEYLEVRRTDLVRTLIYPVPDPALPFLGVHLSHELDDHVLAGPNAVLAMAREGYTSRTVSWRDTVAMLLDPAFWRMGRKYWHVAVGELLRRFDRGAFVREARRLVPALQASDFIPGPSGVRAQAVNDQGELISDFHFIAKADALHVLNAPSPAATASLAIGRHLAERALALFAL